MLTKNHDHSAECEINGGDECCHGKVVDMIGYATCLLTKEKRSLGRGVPEWVHKIVTQRKKRVAAARHLIQVSQTGVFNSLLINNLKIDRDSYLKN